MSEVKADEDIKIEKVRHELDVYRASINSWNWNLANPKASNEDREMFSERLAEDLNNQRHRTHI